MDKEDIHQVTDIDREAFPNEWPPPSFERELRNRMAHYIVVYEGEARATDSTATMSDSNPQNNKPHGFLALLRRWFGLEHSADEHRPSSLPQQKIVGFVGFWIMADEAHITSIAVRNQYRRRGVGELLLMRAIDLATKLGAQIVTLEVRVSNATAQSLYYKYGFKRMGVRKGYYLDNREDGVIMSTDVISSSDFQKNLQRLKQEYCRKWARDLEPMVGECSPDEVLYTD